MERKEKWTKCGGIENPTYCLSLLRRVAIINSFPFSFFIFFVFPPLFFILLCPFDFYLLETIYILCFLVM